MTSSLIVATGATGQLGQTLSRLWAESPLPQYQLEALDRSELDISQADRAIAVLSELKPAVIINAAAYTQVDKAESDSSAAHLVNAEAVGRIAAWSAQNNAKLIHISTDFVFDGSSTTPYRPDHQTNPLGAYGASKLAGEHEIQTQAKQCSAIIRTSWLYSEYGNNFVKTMLRLMGEREQLSVVNDQIGSPTSTHGLAALIFAMIPKDNYQGVYHWTDGASISWYEFAQEIQDQAIQAGLLSKAIPISPISTSEYPTAAQRPAYSVLDRSRAKAEFECPVEDWKGQLNLVIKELASK
ncbi:MAG: dTDP-4-dehydrorhamnose reductase [SAR86 cluster bacterium]|uniref:dTDP-4-dehydrorhamnose reductase n=1 Tax=SAR86 cluster bacterium TaxID=2030880 RepID=A0A2A4X4V0_9GAMM|nr:MAG: dTDP-4-dehydrorhamnose reductase [SAR86 cluster bacterium]